MLRKLHWLSANIALIFKRGLGSNLSSCMHSKNQKKKGQFDQLIAGKHCRMSQSIHN